MAGEFAEGFDPKVVITEEFTAVSDTYLHSDTAKVLRMLWGRNTIGVVTNRGYPTHIIVPTTARDVLALTLALNPNILDKDIEEAEDELNVELLLGELEYPEE